MPSSRALAGGRHIVVVRGMGGVSRCYLSDRASYDFYVVSQMTYLALDIPVRQKLCKALLRQWVRGSVFASEGSEALILPSAGSFQIKLEDVVRRRRKKP